MRGVGQHGLGLACHLTWVPRHSALLGFWVRCAGLANMAAVWRCHLTWVPRHSALLGFWVRCAGLANMAVVWRCHLTWVPRHSALLGFRVRGWPTWPWLGVQPDMGATSFRPAWVSGAVCGVGQHGRGLACNLTWVPRHSALL